MKKLVLLLVLLVPVTVNADPVLVGGGTAAVSGTYGVASWNALGLHIHFTVLNTSVDPLMITSVSNSYGGPWVVTGLDLTSLQSQSFICELPGIWQWNAATFLSATTIYFSGPAGLATPTPEPATLGLLSLGLLAVVRRARRKRRRGQITE